MRGVPASRPLAVLARLARSELAGDEGRELLVGRLSPADAERMPGRIRVHLVTFVDPRVRSGLQQPGAERDGLVVRSARVLDVEVELHLLGIVPCGQSGGTWSGARGDTLKSR